MRNDVRTPGRPPFPPLLNLGRPFRAETDGPNRVGEGKGDGGVRVPGL